jgi:hypothetical protein
MAARAREAMMGAGTATHSADASVGINLRKRNWRALRLVPLAIGSAAMASGLWLGLARLGVPVPGGTPSLEEYHGALMISGFLGTVISLERAVTAGRGWTYLAPALSAAGALALLGGAPQIAMFAFLGASVLLLVASAGIAVRHLALYSVVLAVGAACWALGTIAWLAGYPMPVVVGWWLNFLILTVAAERLDLTKFTRITPGSQLAFCVVVTALLLGSVRGELAEYWAPLTAAGLFGSAVWLLRHDIARATIRAGGQPRFSASCILAGHVWLGVAGVLALTAPLHESAFTYDAVLHAIAIGFILSMIFGHAPIILPAVTGWRVRYSAVAYVPLWLLQISVAIRIAGDLLEWNELRAGSGLLTILALLSYALTLIVASRRTAPDARRARAATGK